MKSVPSSLFELNPLIDIGPLADAFAESGRIQIRDVLTDASARRLANLLSAETAWGLVWRRAADGPHVLRADQADALSAEQRLAIQRKLADAKRAGDYAFIYRTYPLVTAYLEQWDPGGALAQLLEGINASPFLELLRRVSGQAGIVKADGQATLYEAGNFLSRHDDREDAKGRQVAYVLGLTTTEWLPEWGGYLQFFDNDLNIIEAFRPRFNTLSLFRVPQLHSVSEVASEAPSARFAVTGWGRDR